MLNQDYTSPSTDYKGNSLTDNKKSLYLHIMWWFNLDVVLFYYGDILKNERFLLSATKHAKYQPKHLDNCETVLKGHDCLKQIEEKLSALNSNVIVMIINSDYGLINVYDKYVLELFTYFTQSKKDIKLVTNKHPETYGYNLIGSQKYLLMKVKEAIEDLDNDLNKVAEAFIDKRNLIFSNVDDWTKHKIHLKYVHIDKKSVVAHDGNRPPTAILLQKQGANMDKFDHILNIYMKGTLGQNYLKIPVS